MDSLLKTNAFHKLLLIILRDSGILRDLRVRHVYTLGSKPEMFQAVEFFAFYQYKAKKEVMLAGKIIQDSTGLPFHYKAVSVCACVCVRERERERQTEEFVF